MVVTIFRSRLRPEAQEEYAPWAERMSALARTMPGHFSHKTFVAEDGERLTLVEFASQEAQRAWGRHPEHVAAQAKGRSAFYSEYCIQVCAVQREARFPSAR